MPFFVKKKKKFNLLNVKVFYAKLQYNLISKVDFPTAQKFIKIKQ